MASDHRASYDDIQIRTLAVVGVVGALLVFVAIVALQVVYFRYEKAEYERKVIDAPTRQVDTQVAAQVKRLTTAGEGADAEKGEKRIPIDRAMSLVLADYRGRTAGAEDGVERSGADDTGRGPERPPAGEASGAADGKESP